MEKVPSRSAFFSLKKKKNGAVVLRKVWVKDAWQLKQEMSAAVILDRFHCFPENERLELDNLKGPLGF